MTNVKLINIDPDNEDIKFLKSDSAELMRITTNGKVYLHDTLDDVWVEVNKEQLIAALMKYTTKN